MREPISTIDSEWCTKGENMFAILSVILLATNCYSHQSSIDFDFDLNLDEISGDINSFTKIKSPSVDPSVAEDASLSVVLYYLFRLEFFFQFSC